VRHILLNKIARACVGGQQNFQSVTVLRCSRKLTCLRLLSDSSFASPNSVESRAAKSAELAEVLES